MSSQQGLAKANKVFTTAHFRRGTKSRKNYYRSNYTNGGEPPTNYLKCPDFVVFSKEGRKKTRLFSGHVRLALTPPQPL